MSISTQDFISGFDPTSQSTVTGAQLLSMVNAGTPTNAGAGSGTGLVITTTDVAGVPQIPDASTTTKWQGYIWNRIIPNSNSITSHVWNPNNSANVITYSAPGSTSYVQSNWQSLESAAIGAGSIQGFQIAASTITSSNIVSVTQAQVQGLTTALTNFVSLTTAPLVTTQIYGNFTSGLFLTNGSVTYAAFAAGAVNTAALAAGAVTLAKLDTTGTQYQVLSNPTAGNPAWTTPPQIYTGLANPNAGGSDDGKVVAVNSGAAGTFKYVAAAVTPIVKAAYYTTTTQQLQSGSYSNDSASAPTNVVTAMTAPNFTPTSNSNYLIVEAIVPCYVAANNSVYMWAYLYNGAAIIAAARFSMTSSAGTSALTATGTLVLRAKIATPGTSALTFSVGIAGSSGSSGMCVKGETASITIQEWTI